MWSWDIVAFGFVIVLWGVVKYFRIREDNRRAEQDWKRTAVEFGQLKEGLNRIERKLGEMTGGRTNRPAGSDHFDSVL